MILDDNAVLDLMETVMDREDLIRRYLDAIEAGDAHTQVQLRVAMRRMGESK
ncbi:hypothetical protein N9937_02285 [bacterium]|nr:hypothetical protein [bacterium]